MQALIGAALPPQATRSRSVHGVRLGFMSFFAKASRRGAPPLPGRQRLGRRQRNRLPRVLRPRRRGLHGPWTDRPDPARCRRAWISRRSKKAVTDFATRARSGTIDDRGAHRRHVLDHQRRRVRLADVDADRQCAAERDPRHAQDPGATGRRGWPGRDPADDVRRAHLRSPHHRRPRGRAVPGRGEGSARGSARLLLQV